MLWNTDAIIKLLSNKKIQITKTEAGGDYDSSNLIISPKGATDDDDHLYVCGFITEGNRPDPDNYEIEHVEVTDGKDSRGGLNSSDEQLAHVYADVCTKLRKAGFDVVPCLKNYF